MTARRHSRQKQKQDRRARESYLRKQRWLERQEANRRGGDTSILHRHRYDTDSSRSR